MKCTKKMCVNIRLYDNTSFKFIMNTNYMYIDYHYGLKLKYNNTSDVLIRDLFFYVNNKN